MSDHLNFKIEKIIVDFPHCEEFYKVLVYLNGHFICPAGEMKIERNGRIQIEVRRNCSDEIQDEVYKTFAYIFNNKLLNHIFKEFKIYKLKFYLKGNYNYTFRHMCGIARHYDDKLKISLNTGMHEYYVYDLNTRKITKE